MVYLVFIKKLGHMIHYFSTKTTWLNSIRRKKIIITDTKGFVMSLDIFATGTGPTRHDAIKMIGLQTIKNRFTRNYYLALETFKRCCIHGIELVELKNT